MTNFIITLPIKVPVSKKKFINLNLNWYRNVHYFENNLVKETFTTLVIQELKKLNVSKANPPINIEYTVFFPDKRRRDLANVLSIVDKFFCDALVKAGVLEDDTAKEIPQITFIFGGIDKDNPRVECKVKACLKD